MRNYLDLLREVYLYGNKRMDRTGVGTSALFGRQLRYDLVHGFPVVTTKKINFEVVVKELLWMLSGSTNIKDLDAHIWDEWADENGELGPVYGKQWRSWPDYNGGSIDQITRVIESLKNNPWSRRHIVSAWNVADVDQMALPPCHTLFQFYVRKSTLQDRVNWDNHTSRNSPYVLSLQLYQRSGDIFLGVPFNISSYALLLALVSKATGMIPGEFIHTFGDIHLYSNHTSQATTQLSRLPKSLPRLWLNEDIYDIFDFTMYDIMLDNYVSHPFIKAEVAI